MLGKPWILYGFECIIIIFFFFSEGCCRIGLMRAISGIPGNVDECTVGTQGCRGTDFPCCQCCKLGQRVRSMVGIDQCQPRAESGTFGDCKAAFLCCCLDSLGKLKEQLVCKHVGIVFLTHSHFHHCFQYLTLVRL